MNIKRICIFYFCFLFFIITIGFAQQQQVDSEPSKKSDPRDEYTEAERPEEHYLARFEAIKVSEKLSKENLENIYILKVIVSNFKKTNWENDYKDIFENYKKGVSLFYTRDVIYARVELEKNKKAIQELYKKMVELYKKDTREMLTECADKILNFSLDEKTKYDPNKNKVLMKNMMRLWIAYGQIDDANRSNIEGVYKSSISHYRIAKTYAITILEELDPVKSKSRFDIHKADNRNRVLDKAKAPSETKSQTPDKP